MRRLSAVSPGVFVLLLICLVLAVAVAVDGGGAVVEEAAVAVVPEARGNRGSCLVFRGAPIM